ncbi:MAG: hypothetical protein FJ318_07600 [SAR202 cluster bacterium]|nr:hypothetical protein [SAR202 cluster bacterium]
MATATLEKDLITCLTCNGAGTVLPNWAAYAGGKALRCPTCHGTKQIAKRDATRAANDRARLDELVTHLESRVEARGAAAGATQAADATGPSPAKPSVVLRCRQCNEYYSLEQWRHHLHAGDAQADPPNRAMLLAIGVAVPVIAIVAYAVSYVVAGLNPIEAVRAVGYDLRYWAASAWPFDALADAS